MRPRERAVILCARARELSALANETVASSRNFRHPRVMRREIARRRAAKP